MATDKTTSGYTKNINVNKVMEVIKEPSFKPKFYWTGNLHEDAKRINAPHIKKEGVQEDRIAETINIMNEIDSFQEFTLTDAFNIQNRLLSANNYKGIKSGFRTHNVKFSDTPKFEDVPDLAEKMFPVKVMPKEQLLEWYRQIQLIHPLSDLNGRVFGIIVAILNKNNSK